MRLGIVLPITIQFYDRGSVSCIDGIFFVIMAATLRKNEKSVVIIAGISWIKENLVRKVCLSGKWGEQCLREDGSVYYLPYC